MQPKYAVCVWKNVSAQTKMAFELRKSVQRTYLCGAKSTYTQQ